MTLKERIAAAKNAKAATKAEKAAIAAAEKAEFNALPLDEKESIRTIRSSRKALWATVGVLAAGMGVAGGAAIVAAKAQAEAARNASCGEAEYAGICRQF